MYKKILIGVGSALGSAGLLVGGTALIANNKTLSDFFKYPWGSVYEETSDKLNSYDGVIQMYKKKVEELNTEITELRSNLSNTTIEKNNLQNDIKSLTAERDKCLNDIALLEKEKLSNNEKISLLNAQILELENENETLTEDKSSLLLQVESLTKENNDKQTEIDSLNQQVATLNSSLNNANSLITEKDNKISQLESDLLIQTNEVTRLNGLIDSYNEMASVSYEVQFYAGDTLLSACAVKSGEKVLTTKIPTNEEYRIDGWKLSDGTSVDPLNYEITEDTIFYADYVKQYNVTFIDGETTLFTGKLGTDSVSYTAPAKDGYTFVGWFCSVDGKVYVKLSEYNLIQDVVFYAQYSSELNPYVDPNGMGPYGVIIRDGEPDTMSSFNGPTYNHGLVSVYEDILMPVNYDFGMALTLLDGDEEVSINVFSDDYYSSTTYYILGETYNIQGYDITFVLDSYDYQTGPGEYTTFYYAKPTCSSDYEILGFSGCVQLYFTTLRYDINI